MCASPRPNGEVGDVTSPHASAHAGAVAVASEFDATTALTYHQSRSSNRAYQRQQNLVLEMLGAGHSTLLDLGCGTGDLLTAARPRAGWALGIDLSESMLRHASQSADSAQRVAHLQADACTLPLADCSFDAVVSLGLVEYVWPETRLLREMYRVIRPGGTLVVCFPHGNCLPRRFGEKLHHAYLALRKALQPSRPDVSPLTHRPRIALFDREMGRCGFLKDRHRYCFPQLTTWPISHWMRGFDRRLGMSLDGVLGGIPVLARIYVSKWRRQ